MASYKVIVPDFGEFCEVTGLHRNLGTTEVAYKEFVKGFYQGLGTRAANERSDKALAELANA